MQDSNKKPVRILLIDDEEDTFFLIRMTLRKITTTQFHVDWAPTYEEGLAKVLQEDHDIYLLDHDLGGVTGFELMKNALEKDKNIPFIMLTGHEEYKIDLDAMKLGASDFLPKSLLVAPILERSIRYTLERRRTQKELLIARTNQLKTEFLKTMTHELRTPMNVIMGMASLLSQTALAPEQKDYLGEIQRSGDLLLKLIGDILKIATLSGTEKGHVGLEIKDFETTALFAHEVDTLKKAAAQKGLGFNLTVAEDMPTILRGDESRMRLVLSHFIENAIKFTVSGSIHVSCNKKKIDDGSFLLELSVADTGIGISREGQEKLFLPFSQVDGSTTRRFGGAGLGLAIAKHSVDVLGGTIGFESTVDAGSRFWFTAPIFSSESIARLETQKPAKTYNLEHHPSRAPCFLVAEDCKPNQDLIAVMFKKLNYKVKIVQNGQEAVDCIKAGAQFDAIFMDLHMPVMDGFEATTEIRKWESGQAGVPIIALTADILPGTKEKCIAAGMSSYQEKPITIDRLKFVIQELSGIAKCG